MAANSGFDGFRGLPDGAAPVAIVDNLSGTVIAVRADGTRAELGVGDPVFPGDVLETGGDGAIGVVLADGNSFSMAANGSIAFDHAAGGGAEISLSLARGVFAFIGNQIPRNDLEAMALTTPLGTVGILGARVGIELPHTREMRVVLFDDGEVTVMNDAGVEVLRHANQFIMVDGPDSAPSAPLPFDAGALGAVFQQVFTHLPGAGGETESDGLLRFDTEAGSERAGNDAILDRPIRVVGRDYSSEPIRHAGDGEHSGFSLAERHLIGRQETHTEERDHVEVFAGEFEDAVPAAEEEPPVDGDIDAEEPAASAEPVIDTVIEGGPRSESLAGTSGNDAMRGGGGNDTLSGGDGDDTFRVSGTGDGYDRFDGGSGYDRVVGSDGDDAIGFDRRFGPGDSVEEVDGGAGSDVVRGAGGRDRLDFSETTLSGIEGIEGGRGRDTITGSAGDDVITGGAHNDTLAGGGGDDRFVFRDGDGRDTIGDFLEGDSLLFDGPEFSVDDLAIRQNGKDAVVSFGAAAKVAVRLSDTNADQLRGYATTETDDGGVVVTFDKLDGGG